MTDQTQQSEGLDRRFVAGFAVLAVLVRVVFWLVTDRVWEDALITIEHARNAVAGVGLTHHPGEPVTHGFTSALSVLVPLAGELVARDGGLFVIRLVSLGAAIVTIVAAAALAGRLGIGRWAQVLVLGYLAVDQNHVFYGIAGMETQIAVAALLVSAWTIAVRHRLAGIAVGVALLARPDFLIWVAIAVVDTARRARGRLPGLLAGATLVVGPWLVFATVYYGSPIPQTIVAKSFALSALPLGGSLDTWLAWAPRHLANHIEPVMRTFAPFLEDTRVIGAPLPSVALLAVAATVVVLTILGAIDRRRDPLWQPLIAFVGLYLLYRIVFLPTSYFDWYVPPFTAFAVFLAGAGIERIAAARPRAQAVTAVALTIAFLFPLPWVLALERTVQTEVETAVRAATARRVGELAAPGQGVISESAGYVGYFSDATLYDFPGLTSRTSLDALRAMPPGERNLWSLVDRLRPPWLILRPLEYAELQRRHPEAAAMYEVEDHLGERRPEVEAWGYVKFNVDSEFVILRHR